MIIFFFQNTVQDVSIFEYLINDNVVGETTLAKCAVKHLKTLKHPNIVTFLDSSEVKTKSPNNILIIK